MGTSYSLSEKEKVTWNYNCLLFDEDTREFNRYLIDRYFPKHSKIKQAKRFVCVGGLTYEHFFITDMKEKFFLEFSSEVKDSEKLYDTHRVQLNILPHGKFDVCNDTEMTPEIRERMIQMLGMSNYSLCLRNSEHVANYIFTGHWVSFQMEAGGGLFSHFQSNMTADQRKRINVFPSTISPTTIEGKITPALYSMIDKQYNATSFQYFSNGNEESYNILVVGKATIYSII